MKGAFRCSPTRAQQQRRRDGVFWSPATRVPEGALSVTTGL